MRRVISILGSAILLHSTIFADEQPDNVSSFVKSNNSFAADLYTHIKNSNEDNFVFCPFSISSCLSMVYMGARGETAAQMRKVLSLDIDPKVLPKTNAALIFSLMAKSMEAPGYQLSIANGMWLDQKIFILSGFRHMLTSEFKAKVETLDFAQSAKATAGINDWISSATQEKIPSLLQPSDISADTRLVLANAVFFKGNWTLPFNPKVTKPLPFYSVPESSCDTAMMNQINFFPYYENDLLQVLALPFIGTNADGGQIACLIALPKSAENLPRVEEDLSSTIEKWLSNLARDRIDITIPKFTLNNRYELNQTLQKLGMENAFFPGANFAGIDGMRDLFLSKVLHQTFFALDEAGVTAAAATAASFNVTSTGPQAPPVSFLADHPFLFLLVDLKSHLVLFAGKCSQPQIQP